MVHWHNSAYGLDFYRAHPRWKGRELSIAIALGACLLGASAPRYPGATAVAVFDFRLQAQADLSKPAGWTRHESPDYPFYVDASVVDEASAVAGQCLRFRLNGGNCAYFSPKIEAHHDFSYVVRAQIKTQGLTRDSALILLEFLDGQGKAIGGSAVSKRVGGTSDWQMVEIGPVAPAAPGVEYLRVACISQAGNPPDLTGAVYFDDVWIGRLPRFEVETSSAYRLFDVTEPKRVTIKVRGFEDRELDGRFYLFREDGFPLAEETVAVSATEKLAVVDWEIPTPDVGYYLLDVVLQEGSRPLMRKQFSITVMEMKKGRVVGDFGLSLPPPRHGLAHLERLLAYSGARWVKFPIWSLDDSTPKLHDRAFAELLERLARRGHEVVGKLETATPQIRAQLAQEDVRIADVLSHPPDVWGPSLEATLVRFGLKVMHWQLGADDDASFLGLAGLDSPMHVLRHECSRVGRDIRLGIVWDWFTPPPEGVSDFLAVADDPDLMGPSRARSSDTALSSDELGFQIGSLRERLRASPTEASSAGRTTTRVWTHIRALGSEEYSRRDRVWDLARRLVAAKMAYSDAIFAVDVADPRHGLFAEDGAPNELFTVFRTIAVHLADKQYVGSLPLDGPSSNHLFLAGDKVAMVAWSDEPTTLEAVLGAHARVLDLWGRTLQGPVADETRRIPLDDMPVLIVDMDEFLVRFQLGLRFERGDVTSRFGVHQDRLLIHNPSRNALAGTAVAQFPRPWNPRPAEFPVAVSRGESTGLPFALTMPQGVAQGEYQIPIDFRLTTNQSYRFRLHRPFRVGGDELRVELTTRSGPEGELEIEGSVTNLTQTPISLTATARTLGRKAEIDFVSNLAPGATATTRFSFRDGAHLVGKNVQIKFEDIGGRREFTYDVVAKP